MPLEPDKFMSYAEAVEIQEQLASRISRDNYVKRPRYIAGVDISARRGQETAAASIVVLKYPELEVVEARVARGKLDFPYIPGLLSFREIPLTLAAYKMLSIRPDLIMVDGQGIAHPRRIGLASHLGLVLNTPTIGCAKSLLCGSCGTPGNETGNYARIVENGETIGAALRTRPGVKPVFISIGHKISFQATIRWVLRCGKGYRIPEPTRLAHMSAKDSSALETARA